MKKVFKIIFTSIFFLLFFIVLNIYIKKDNENFYTNFGYNTKYNNYNVSLNKLPSNEDKIELLNKIIMLSEEDFSIILSQFKDRNGKLESINSYVSAKDKFIKEMLPKGQTFNENFSLGNNYISTGSELNNNKIKLFSFYNKVNYRMFPLKKVEENLDILKYDFSVYYSKDLDKNVVKDMLNEQFSDYNVSIREMHAEKYDELSEAKTKILYISIVTLIISSLFILFTISYNLKNISILKLNGYKNFDILKELFKKDALFVFLLSIILPIVLTMFVIREINIRVIEFTIVTIMAGLLIFIAFIISNFIAILLISKYPLSDFIKNKNINNLLANLSYIMLIISTLVVFPMIKDNITNVIDTIKYYFELSKDSKNIENINQINIVNDEKREWEFDIISYFENKENINNKKIIKIYDDLEKMDALYRFSDIIFTPKFDGVDLENQKSFLAHEINEKYYNETNFYNDGEKIKIESKDDFNIFMDKETYKNNKWDKENFVTIDIKTKIYIFDKVEYKKISESNIKEYDNEKYPIFVYTNNESIFSKDITSSGVFIDNIKIAEVKEYFRKHRYDSNIELSKVNDRIANFIPDFKRSIENNLIALLPGLISLISIYISFTNFYILSMKKEISILKSLGYKIKDLISSFIFDLSLVILVYFSYSYLIKKELSIYNIVLIINITLGMILYLIYSIKNTKIIDN